MDAVHAQAMDRALVLAARNPAAPFGAVIVSATSGEVLGEGVNDARSSPTRHGEMVAIDAWAAAGRPEGEGGLVLVTTAEPCPMCMAAVLWAGIGTVVYGTSVPTLVRLGWRQFDLRAEEVVRRAPFASCRLVGGVRVEACDRLFAAAGRTTNDPPA